MVDIKLLDYNSKKEYLDDFQRTLLKTVHNYDFFVNWDKVFKYTQTYFMEFSLINSLTAFKTNQERKTRLKEIFTNYPRTIKVIPALVAVREKDIEVAEFTSQIIYRHFDFGDGKPTPSKIDEMVSFCERIKIIDLLGKIKDVYSYVLGVEVGLDSNARKNRSGEVFKNLINNLIDSVIKQLADEGYPLSYSPEVELSKLGYRKQKKADFVINYNSKPLIFIEVNIYHESGSKPIEIIRSYTEIENLINKNTIKFLWITDGPGWQEMWTAFTRAINDIDLIMNYDMSLRKLRGLILKII
jgi:type II restriction enzyme